MIGKLITAFIFGAIYILIVSRCADMAVPMICASNPKLPFEECKP